MTDREAMKQALEALYLANTREWPTNQVYAAINALQARLAQPDHSVDANKKVEPVVFNTLPSLRHKKTVGPIESAMTGRPQTAAQWVGLTDEDIEKIETLKAPPVHPDYIDCDDWFDFARAIEAKLKEKNR